MDNIAINKMTTRITLSDQHYQAAMETVNKEPVYEKSFRGKQGNVVGFLGEVVAEEWFKHHGLYYEDHRSSTKLDYIINEKFTVDIKTKDFTVYPKRFYRVSVPLYNHDHQRPDYFLFHSYIFCYK